MPHPGPPVQAKIVRIQDEQYQFSPQGSQSAYVSSEFAEEDDYYSAHFGSPADDQQAEKYYHEEGDYDYCYASIAEGTEEQLTANVNQPNRPLHSAYLSAGIESPSSMARIHKMPMTPVPKLIEH